jgi:hypothetical protein
VFSPLGFSLRMRRTTGYIGCKACLGPAGCIRESLRLSFPASPPITMLPAGIIHTIGRIRQSHQERLVSLPPGIV